MDLTTLNALFEELELSGSEEDYDAVIVELTNLEKHAGELLEPINDSIDSELEEEFNSVYDDE